jgi:hypothetical protein
MGKKLSETFKKHDKNPKNGKFQKISETCGYVHGAPAAGSLAKTCRDFYPPSRVWQGRGFRRWTRRYPQTSPWSMVGGYIAQLAAVLLTIPPI